MYQSILTFSYLHCAWKYLMRFCSRSTPFLILISLTLSRYCKDVKHRFNLFETTNPGIKWGRSHRHQPDLTHLELEESPLLLHLLCDFRPTDFRPDHPVLSCVFLLLLLYLGAANDIRELECTTQLWEQHKKGGGMLWKISSTGSHSEAGMWLVTFVTSEAAPASRLKVRRNRFVRHSVVIFFPHASDCRQFFMQPVGESQARPPMQRGILLRMLFYFGQHILMAEGSRSWFFKKPGSCAWRQIHISVGSCYLSWLAQFSILQELFKV